ncbi:MAG: hypothetical protein ACRCZG_04765, partial [Culicoidibacterales bacterium]
GKIIGAITSLGGSYMLELHGKHYEDMYEAIYRPACYNIQTIEKQTKDCLSSIGEQLTKLNKILVQVGKILNSRANNFSVTQQSLTQINKFQSGFNTSLNTGFGGLVGGSTAIGAWGLVSLIGSASTGTAISSLSGVAATNATLAWFGGGSLATGGAGMAGGLWVLGGLVAAPIVFFTTKNAYKKVDEIKERKLTLISETTKLNKLTPSAITQLSEAKKQQEHIKLLLEEYLPIINGEFGGYPTFRTCFWIYFRR